ncbi:MAG: restriction endonuclease [Candidatus Bathyarchaeota archaeon]|nr:restriction endonuclease [Candidatus Bathyarchaeota archaeon]
MSVERNLLISLLKCTQNQAALIEDVNKHSHLPTALCRELLQTLQNQNIIYLKDGSVEIDSENRLKIALKAITQGADIQAISNLLCWQEFEEITAQALKANGYTVTKNVRFKHGGRRWEIDVVGCRKPLVVCVDCKRWQHAISPSALKRMVESQTQRTVALADCLPNPALNLECGLWEKARFVPAVLSLTQNAYKYVYDVPVVPVLSLQDFICQLPIHICDVKFYGKTFPKLSHDV